MLSECYRLRGYQERVALISFIPVFPATAIEYFKRAFEHGHWRAPYMLALAHEAGAGVEPNCTAALKYMRAFFTDRSAWGDQLTAAVKLLDKGGSAERDGEGRQRRGWS